MLTTILGAGGPIGNELAKIPASGRMLQSAWLGAGPKPFAGAELIAADISEREQTIAAV